MSNGPRRYQILIPGICKCHSLREKGLRICDQIKDLDLALNPSTSVLIRERHVTDTEEGAVCQSIRAAIMEYQTGWLLQHLFLSSRDYKAQIKVPAHLAPGETPFPCS